MRKSLFKSSNYGGARAGAGRKKNPNAAGREPPGPKLKRGRPNSLTDPAAISLRLERADLTKLQVVAQHRGQSVAGVLRHMIGALPDPRHPEIEF